MTKPCALLTRTSHAVRSQSCSGARQATRCIAVYTGSTCPSHLPAFNSGPPPGYQQAGRQPLPGLLHPPQGLPPAPLPCPAGCGSVWSEAAAAAPRRSAGPCGSRSPGVCITSIHSTQSWFPSQRLFGNSCQVLSLAVLPTCARAKGIQAYTVSCHVCRTNIHRRLTCTRLKAASKCCGPTRGDGAPVWKEAKRRYSEARVTADSCNQMHISTAAPARIQRLSPLRPKQRRRHMTSPPLPSLPLGPWLLLR